MAILYLDKSIKNGNNETRLAKVVPAPRSTKTDGSAQQRRVEVEANRARMFEIRSFILSVISHVKGALGQLH